MIPLGKTALYHHRRSTKLGKRDDAPVERPDSSVEPEIIEVAAPVDDVAGAVDPVDKPELKDGPVVSELEGSVNTEKLVSLSAIVTEV